MHNFGTCEKRTAAQWQNPIFPVSKHVFFFGSRHCAAVLQMQVLKLYTDLDLNLLYILILGTYSKFAWKNNFLAFTELLTNRFVSTTKNSMKCVVNWILLRICDRSRNTQPHIKVAWLTGRWLTDRQWLEGWHSSVFLKKNSCNQTWS